MSFISVIYGVITLGRKCTMCDVKDNEAEWIFTHLTNDIGTCEKALIIIELQS